MPKVIENLRARLLDEAKRQVSELGYGKTTVKSVASALGVGVGTVYNYFPSKDMLVASFMFEDWQAVLDSMSRLPTNDPERLICGIYTLLKDFAEKNQKLFSDSEAAKVIAMSLNSRHKLLRAQIAEFILPICKGESFCDPIFASEFIAEALISWSMENADLNAVYGVIENMLNK